MPQTASNNWSRTNVTAADADASAADRFLVGDAGTIRLGAVGNMPGASIGLCIYFLDSNSQVVCVQEVQFATGSAADWAGNYVARASVDPCWPTGGAFGVAIAVGSMSPGAAWTIRAMTD